MLPIKNTDRECRENLSKSFYSTICLLGIFFFSCYVVSCKNTEKSDQDEKENKLEYTPQINEVEVITLERIPFKKQLLSNGKLVAKRKALLSFESSGIISSIKVENGSYVQKGATIAELDHSSTLINLQSAKINLQKAEFEMFDHLVGLGYKARDTLSIDKELFESVKMQSGYTYARSEYLRVENEAKKRYLIAPFSGKIADISGKLYEQTSGTFCTIIDDREFYIDFFVMSSELSFCKKGMDVKVVPFGIESVESHGKITNINPTVNTNGQVIVTALVKNNNKLIDGLDVKVVVEDEIKNQLVVPKSAVVVRDGLDVVFTYTDDGLAHWVYVKIISANENSYIIEANKDRSAILNEGDKIIISGNLNLADKSEVTIKQ